MARLTELSIDLLVISGYGWKKKEYLVYSDVLDAAFLVAIVVTVEVEVVVLMLMVYDADLI